MILYHVTILLLRNGINWSRFSIGNGTLRELVFAGNNFHEFREFLTISPKLVPVKIIGDYVTREIRES